MIISLLNQKGGVGKTTLAINLTRYFHLQGHKTLLVDSDPQGSARHWHASADGEFVDLVVCDVPTIDKDIHKFARGYDYVFIDGAPQLSSMASKTVKCSDLVLIPVQPSGLDLHATESMVDLVHTKKALDEVFKAAIIISRLKCGTAIGNEIRAALKEYDVPLFDSFTTDRTVYATATALHKTIFESTIKTAKLAIDEIALIATEIMGYK